MISHTVGGIIFLILTILFAILPPIYNMKPLFSKVCITAMVICLILTITAAAASSYSIKPVNLQEVNAVENIVSLNDNNIIKGARAYYRSMYINESQYYQYMVDLGNGQYIQNQIPSNETYVSYIPKDDTVSKPRVEWLKKRRQLFIFYYDTTYWKLYVPEGTIAEEFNIDLK